MTTWALIVNLIDFVEVGDWLLAPLDLAIFVLAMWLIVEAVVSLRQAWTSRRWAPQPEEQPSGDDQHGADSR